MLTVIALAWLALYTIGLATGRIRIRGTFR